MTSKKIAYATTDGIAIIWPNPKNRGEDETEAQFLARVWERNIETAAQKDMRGNIVNPHLTKDTPFVIVDASDLPTDRADRAKWKIKDGKIVVGK